jgi:hypothetical protein
MRPIWFSSLKAAMANFSRYLCAKFTTLGINGHVGKWVPPLPYSLLTLWSAGDRNSGRQIFVDCERNSSRFLRSRPRRPAGSVRLIRVA